MPGGRNSGAVYNMYKVSTSKLYYYRIIVRSFAFHLANIDPKRFTVELSHSCCFLFLDCSSETASQLAAASVAPSTSPYTLQPSFSFSGQIQKA